MSEKIGRDLIRQVIGKPEKSWPTRKLSFTDLIDVRDKGIRNFVRYAPRLRLPGMIKDLDEHDKRSLAFFEAAVEVLNNLGVLDYDRFMATWQEPFTEIQEVITEQTYGANFTEQKK
jgi:hypothetical protein